MYSLSLFKDFFLLNQVFFLLLFRLSSFQEYINMFTYIFFQPFYYFSHLFGTHQVLVLRQRSNFSFQMFAFYSTFYPYHLLNFFFFFFFFMAVLSLRFCAKAFSSYGKRGPLFIAVRGPLTITASLVAEHRLHTRRLSNCGSRAQLLRGMWDLPRPGLEPVSPALAGGFSTTAPPGKPIC